MWTTIAIIAGFVLVFALFVYLGRRGDGPHHPEDKRHEIPPDHGSHLGGGSFGS